MEDSTSPDLALLEDFGQRVDLTRRIREVLINYPEGTTVLRELIQNADDAGATRVCLCLDRRAHRSESVLSSRLAQWQGPALLAYNDAVFSEEDFVSISRIGDSKKQSQAWKTGRFGVGFNSVYHLTDLPSFVSGKYAVLFDPQVSYLPNISAANPGKRINYVSSSALSKYPDQFSPYVAFGCDMKTAFPGTLFRFPLRNSEQAKLSRLSKQAYSENDISALLSQLYEEAVFTMLFLKSVVSVEMYVWETGADAPEMLYSCSVKSPDKDIAWHRKALVRFSSSGESQEWQRDTFAMDFVSEAYLGAKSEKKVCTYFISQGLASALSKIGGFASVAAKEYDLHLLPWASVAACISDGSEDNVLRDGRAFCFLPLPVHTGLSVQVNAYFEISSNRRDIWYGGDMDRGGKFRSDWNRLLLEDVVAPLFNELLLGLRSLHLPLKLYYSLWPTGSFEGPWAVLVQSVYKSIRSSPVLFTQLDGGTWVPPAKAFMHDEKFVNKKDLGEALVLAKMPVVCLPSNIISMFSEQYTSSQFTLVSPEIVSYFLKGCKSLVGLQKSSKLVLLEYCLSNMEAGDVGDHLRGLPLIPLANNQFGVFSNGGPYYICNELEYELLTGVSDRLINRSISPDLFEKLSQIARGFSNIEFIDAPAFLRFFPVIFPSAWELKNQVSWNPKISTTVPTAAWFKLFWEYLGESSYDLGLFAYWPILPSTSGYLHRPLTTSKLINAESLSPNLKHLIEKIGCRVLDPSYGVKHSRLSLYVHDGDASGVISSIFELISVIGDNNLSESLFEIVSPDERDELFRFLLDSKWYIGGSLRNLDINKCKKLPIYRVYNGGYADLFSSKKYLPPVGVSDHLLDSEFINCTSSAEKDVLTRYYKIGIMRKPFFYQKNVINRITELDSEVRDSVMLMILQDLPQLSFEEPKLKESLKALKFVPTINGDLRTPQSLYDPRVEELYTLLEDSDCFPTRRFQDPGVLDMLLPLGLRTSVSTDTLIQSARQVESLMHKDQTKAHSRAKALLSYLELHSTKWAPSKLIDGQNQNKAVNSMLARVTTALRTRDLTPESELERFWAELKMICWCPVLVDSPHPALPWPVVSSMVAPPKQVRLQSDMWIVSASSRILDGDCVSSALLQILGWSIPPSGNVIAAQLLEMGKNNEIVTDQALRQELALVMPKIYSLLRNLVGSDEMEIVKAVLEGSRWIWVGDGFAKADEVVLSGQLHLAPYIRVIPVDLAVFKELFLELGIKEYLGATDYANILSRIAAKKGSASLDPTELRMAGLVVQHLAEFQFQDFKVQIYLPDSTSRMCPSTDLVFNDAPWLLESGENNKAYVHNFVHGNISNDMAEKLGVRSLRRFLLAESSDSMNLTLSGVAEAFGQHEALTTRLKHIVDMYADGPGILFELVQNAEDARASEVVFLLDKTQYGTSSILSPEMAEWQGPALYCFNDSVFSPQDLYAISRIGQDSKLEKPFAIGRFGLGFNCVYHFTDIPGFVSGENIVIFDPHAFYLPGISPSHPGLRIKFAGRRIFEQFPDQFAPFLQFGCDLQQSFPGTLFRFPLRNGTTAHRSQIKKEKYTPDDVTSLFSTFSQVVPEALLFLRNVKKISLYVKEGPNEQMRLVHHVSRHQTGDTTKDPMLNFVKGNRPGVMNRDQFLTKLSKTSDVDLPWSCQKTAIIERTPATCLLHSWIISECIGGGNAKRLSMVSNNQSRNFNFIPWASLAAYLHSVKVNEIEWTGEEINDDAIVKYQEARQDLSRNRRRFEGRAFCFLPLPVTTSLPLHVNAYFELSSNRRDIWIGNDMSGGGKVRSEWNMALLEDVASPAYGRLLSALSTEMGPTDLFTSFWPTSVAVEPWASMTRKLYSHIADLNLQVLYSKQNGGRWLSPKKSIFPDFSFAEVTKLTETLAEAGLSVVSLPKPVVEKFMESCPTLYFLTPAMLTNMLIRRKRGFLMKDAAILALEYCLTDMSVPDSDFFEKLQGLPLVPLANGSFTEFSKRGEGERVFFTSQVENDLVMGSVPHLLIARSVPESVLEKLHEIARNGESNVFLFTCHSLVEMFPRILPPEWQRAGKVIWAPGEGAQPSLDWMRSLWSYLKLSCSDLSVLSEWPVLPVEDGSLLQLRENSNVIRDEGWSENMHSLLKKLGFCFLRSDLQVDHPQLKLYVQEPTAAGVLNGIKSAAGNAQEIKGLFATASVAELHELRSFIFQSKWFSGNQIGLSQTSVIKFLPIFESYKGRELTCLVNPKKWLKPDGVPDEILNENFVRTESEKESSILRSFLDVREPNKAEMYKNLVLSRISEFVTRPALLLAILSDVKNLMEGDDSLKASVSEIPFVSTISGAWSHPSRLYDPRIPELQSLLHKEAYFPSKEFTHPQILDLLAFFGLKTTLGYTTLLDSAKSVSMMHDSNNPDAVLYGRKLFLYLDALSLSLSKQSSHANDDADDGGAENVKLHEVLYSLSNFKHDLAEDEFWREIRAINWCPVCVSPPIERLPWFSSQDKIANPNMTRPKSQTWLISSKMRVLDGECRSMYVQRMLGWLDSPDVNVLCTQLIELSKCYDELKARNGEDFAIDSVLKKEIPIIYAKLQDFVGTGDGLKTVKEELGGLPWVYIGHCFVTPRALAFDSPVNYPPYLYIVPSELADYRLLLSSLGVRLTFDARDYVIVLQQLHRDIKGEPLSDEHVEFVHRVLEAFGDTYSSGQPHDALLNSLLIPDSNGVLVPSRSLVYNDAPWMDNSTTERRFVHQSIGDDLAKRLGVQSLRGISLVEQELMTDLKCMDYAKICELLALYMESDFLLFDILELADFCGAKKVHLIHDKREHPRQSLLQHNLGDFQGSALTVVLEGVVLTQEEVCGLHLPPPWKLRGNTLRYGLGLVSGYFVCDLLTVLSDNYFYVFDPLGLTGSGSASSSAGSSTKLYSLKGTDLCERFRDQFRPMHVTQETSLDSSNSTVIRMPLSSKCLNETEDGDCKRVKQIFNRFIKHSSSTLLFLKSVFQVSLSTWEDGSAQPTLNHSVLVDPSAAVLRNPFSEKKWRKWQIKRLFNSSNSAIKMHTIDVHVIESGASYVDKWFVVLALGSGQTRNMALDRRYLAYNLTPAAGVAAHVSRDGNPPIIPSSSCILSPLPLSGSMSMPVTALGHFLVGHNAGRYILSHTNGLLDAVEAWNKELMLCVLDSYAEMVLEFQKIRKDPLSSSLEPRSARSVSAVLHLYGDKVYTFWPRSTHQTSSSSEEEGTTLKAKETTEWHSLVEQVIRPFYKRLADLPVWQLYGGNLVRVDEGMFLAQPGSDDGDNGDLPSDSVCSFMKEHYPVFSVPSELVTEIQAVGVSVREIKPRMVRDQLKASSSVVLRSIDTFIDVLEYCLSDLHPYRPPSADVSHSDNHTGSVSTRRETGASTSIAGTSSGGDAIEIVSYFGKALYDFSRGVVEDISRGATGPHNRTGGDVSTMSPLVVDLRGVPFPTVSQLLTRLGSSELWIGTEEQQQVMLPLVDMFIHHQCFEKTILNALLTNEALHGPLKLKSFSPQLVSAHLRSLFDSRWVKMVCDSDIPWVPWGNSAEFSTFGPSPKWVRDFWRIFKSMDGDISLLSNWPLIPAYLDRPVLCRVKVSRIIFWPPITDANNTGVDALRAAFDMLSTDYPWLFPLLNKLNIPIHDVSFPECYSPCNPSALHGQSLSCTVLSKILANKSAGYLPTPLRISDEDRERLFSLFERDFESSHEHTYQMEELDVLRELPIYKTVIGTYTSLTGLGHCTVSPNAFFQPNDARCLSSSSGAASSFLSALGVEQLTDQQVLVRFALPGFESRTAIEQEDVLLHLYANWRVLETNPEVVNILRETKYVKNANENTSELFKPKDLLDPLDPVLTSVFAGVRDLFPGERFMSDGWIRILKKTGLRMSSESDIMIECAKKIEEMGKNHQNNLSSSTDEFEVGPSSNNTEIQIPIEMWSLAESVVSVIFENFLYDTAFCDRISGINFVPAERGFPCIGGKTGGKRVFCSYRDAILIKDWPLAWSSAPMLTKQSVVPPEYSLGAFRLRSPPVFSTVLKHLQMVGKYNGEDTLAHWPTSSGVMSVESTFLEILRYLDKIWETLSSADKDELKKLAFIPVANGTRLVAAKYLFARLSINMSPFAFELPGPFLPFITILREMGMQESLTISYARDLLLSAQKSCGYQRLNPNELRAVMEILNFVCSDEASQQSDFDMVVPDDGCRLVSAGSCVYVDASGARLLSSIDTSRLRFGHPGLSENICGVLGIKKLSDVVVEELDEVSGLEVVSNIGPVSIDQIKAKLLNNSVQNILFGLISSITNHFPSFKAPSLLQTKKLLENTAQRILFVKHLYTRFLLLPRRLDITRVVPKSTIPDWPHNRKHRTVYYVDDTKTHAFLAEPPSFLTIYDIISVVISRVLEMPLVLPVGPLFACPDGTEKQSVEILKLGSEISMPTRKGRYDASLGNDLLSQDAQQVQFLPLRPFYKGEIIAWKSGRGGDKLRYGRVPEDVRPSAGQAIYRLPVEVGLGEKQMLLSTQVFSFKSASMSDGGTPSKGPELERIRGGEDNSSRGSTGGVGNGEVINQANMIQPGKVSTSEVVHAVHDMLSAAGINFDAEKQTLLQSTLSLQDQLKESQVALLVQQEKAEAATKEADALKAAWSCRICLSSEVNAAMVPCGHVLCHGCSASVARCPFCRAHVSRKMKIFRP